MKQIKKRGTNMLQNYGEGEATSVWEFKEDLRSSEMWDKSQRKDSIESL